MSIRATLTFDLNREIYQTEEAAEALAEASGQNGAVYSWKTVGRENWLEKGFSRSDVLALLVLPAGLPETIGMPDDVFTTLARRHLDRRRRRGRGPWG